MKPKHGQRSPSSLLALILSLIPGVGQIYAGQPVRGLAVLIFIPVIGWMILPFYELLIFILAVVGALKAYPGNKWHAPVVGDLAEKQAATAAHKLEAEARHALAHADGHMPHTPPSSLPSTVAGLAASAVEHAARTPEDIAADHMYENVVERLRRDLLAERERMGNLLGEWP